MGSILVMADARNPDRLALAAHGLRELMEKLPRYLALPVAKPGGGLGGRARNLALEWSKLRLTLPLTAVPDKRTAQFLQRLAAFFAWLDADAPTRRQQAALTIRELDPTRQALPEPIANLRVTEWDKCHEAFEAISHHGRDVTVEQLGAWIDVLERFLLDHLRPRTFEDHARIDQLIIEGESDGEG